jgi:hypothetical protein
MQQYLSDLKTFCFQLPTWQMLTVQAFFYGALNWLIPHAEQHRIPNKTEMTMQDLVEHSDPEFSSWPADWLESWLDRLLELKLSHEQLYEFSEQLDLAFRDCIPTDLDIYSTLAEGRHLTEEQWERLYTAVAPHQQILPLSMSKKCAKTRRTHGKRAITPLKRRRAQTHHRPHVNVVKIG